MCFHNIVLEHFAKHVCHSERVQFVRVVLFVIDILARDLFRVQICAVVVCQREQFCFINTDSVYFMQFHQAVLMTNTDQRRGAIPSERMVPPVGTAR